MIYSDIRFGKQAQDSLLEGVRTLEQAVGSTLGPLGRNVAIAHVNPYGDVYDRVVLHDGVRVAKSINLLDPFQNMGAQILKEAAQKQVQDVGDGTTVVTILGKSIFEEIYALSQGGVNPMLLRRGIEKATERLIEEIKTHAINVDGFEQMRQIATISSEDTELGELVATVINDMGKDGLVYAEESQKNETIVEKQEGMQIDKGYAHQNFVTNPQRMESIMENPLVLVTDKAVNQLQTLKHILEHCAQSSRSLVIFTPQIGMDALSAMIENKLRGVIYSCVIKAPSFGQNQKNTLEDIAIFTGAKYITEDAGHRFEDITPEDLGGAEYITATKNDSIIVGGKGKKDAVNERVETIKNAIEREESEFDREKMKERLARLTTGVAVIKVGGSTEIEMKERLERVKDAIAATQAALESGIVPGGETIYLKIRNTLTPSPNADKYEVMAYTLLQDALYKPFQKLLTNAGMNDGEWYEKLSNAKNPYYGVDVTKGRLVDMYKEGIVDPTLVSIQALKNATSVAIQLATTGTIVNQYVEEKKK